MLNFVRNTRFIIVSLVLFLIFLGIVLFSALRPSGNSSATPTPFPVPSNTAQNYTQINLLTPGKSNYDDVIRLIGYPANTNKKDNNNYLYYKTPLSAYENVVVLKNNIVFYALENVYGTYRGTLQDALNKYGKPSLVVYKDGDPFEWQVYLKKGLVVEADASGNILTAVYFIPGDKDYFLKGVAQDIGLVANQPSISE